MDVLVGLVLFVVLLVAIAAMHDVRARRRGTYRSASEWRDVSSQRRGVAREIKGRRRGANGTDRR